MMKNVLEVNNLTKKFGNFTAVNNISFTVKEGELLGFLGPNGAGKTTTIQMLLSVLAPTSGEILYFGKNLKQHREDILEQVNFSTTYINLPWNLTIKENLTFMSYLYTIKNRKKKVDEIIEVFKLSKLANHQMHQLSAGQITRVNLAKAFLNNPKVLLLDEPTASLDPDIAAYIRSLIMEKNKQEGLSVILTSHNMAEVEEVCDRVMFINKGKIIADDAPENLSKSIEICHIELLVRKESEKLVVFCKKMKLKYSQKAKNITVIDVKEKEIPEFLRGVMDAGIQYDEISIEKPTLEDYFLQVSNEALDADDKPSDSHASGSFPHEKTERLVKD